MIMGSNSMFSNYKDIGIDLGSSNVLAYIKGKGIVLREPTVAAADRNSGRIIAFGEKASIMLCKAPGNIILLHPFKDGAIYDYYSIEKLT